MEHHRLPRRPHRRHLSLSVRVFLILCFSPLPVRAQDCNALVQFRDHLLSDGNQPSLIPRTWNQSADCCSWEGVNCTSDVVTGLILRSLNLTGTIPPSLFNLAYLNNLDLSHNGFSGWIPKDFISLGKLQHLDLSWNSFDGVMPSELYQIESLVQLIVAGNSLQYGIASSENVSATSLQLLDLSNNKFEWWEHSHLTRLENMTKLILGGNQFGIHFGLDIWSIIRDLNTSKSLQNLDLSRNGFNGSVSNPTVELPTALVNLTMRDNNLTGDISVNIQKPGNLRILDMGNTSLSGTIPLFVQSLINLEELILDHNDLRQGLEKTLVSLPNLQVLDISYNRFNGSVPSQVFGSSHALVSLNFSNNEFQGILPNEFSDLVNLMDIDASYNNLSGEIPSTLQNCSKLHFVRLQNNNFNGTFPMFFKDLQELELLDLSSNNLYGPIPTGGIFDDPSKFLIDGNINLCRDNPNNEARVLKFCHEGHTSGNGLEGSPTRKSKSGLPKAALAIIIIIVLIIFVVLLLFWLFYKHNCFKNANFGGFAKDFSLLTAPLSVTCSDLQTATKGFSSAYLIGSGGIGSVYRGFLEHKKEEVAVKVLKEDIFGDSKSFLEECHSIRMFKHNNLVKLLTSCMNVDINGNRFKALIYEFMPNGNLEMWLHEEVVSQALRFKKWNLNLYQRLSMAIDVASLLSHLHFSFEMPTVHCNLKPSNILVAEDMTAHVTDFGMDKFFKVEVIVRNSAGYIAPECLTGSPISPKWDVYSFGVILLEMFTGKRPTDEDFGGTLSLQTYVQQGCLSNIEEIIDPLLLSEETSGKLTDKTCRCITSILNIALICSKEFPGERMDIKEALEKLELAKAAFLDAGGNGDNTPHTTFDRFV